MESTMKKKKWFLFLLALLVAAGLFLWGFLGDYSRALEANWGFSLPWRASCRELYAKDTGPSFHGDGIRCHVYGYANGEAIAGMLTWSDKEGTTIYGKSYSEAAEEWLDNLQVPNTWRPDYANCSYCYLTQEDNSQNLVIWNRDLERIYILEFFI